MLIVLLVQMMFKLVFLYQSNSESDDLIRAFILIFPPALQSINAVNKVNIDP